MAQFQKWKAAAEKGDINGLRRVLIAFRAACHISETKEESAAAPFAIGSPDVFNDIMFFTLHNFTPICNKILSYTPPADVFTTDVATDEESRISLPSASSKKLWKRAMPLAKSFLWNVFHFLKTVTNTELKQMVLKACESYIPYLACFSVISKKFLGRLLEIWTSDDEQARILAFLVIYRMAIVTPFPFIELAYKQTYLTFFRNSKFVSTQTLPTVHFMINCLVELYSIDPVCAYQHAFVYIRQLANHLRNAIATTSKESYQGVYNWQFVNSLKAWGKVVSALSQKYPETMRPLIYPLVQVIIGAIQLVPTARYYPLRFHLIRILNNLADDCDILIPTAPYLLDILCSKNFSSGKPSSARAKPIRFGYAIKVSKGLLKTAVFYNGVAEQVFELLLEYLAIHSDLIAFPELSVPVVVALKKFKKTCRVAQWSRSAAVLLDACQSNTKFVESKRLTEALSSEKLQESSAKITVTEDTPLRALHSRKIRFKQVQKNNKNNNTKNKK
eukprot:TRINITY_DN6704_c0_g1_i1.p1 TRINITY_DN6704_c0_g1~~TRINITY_DN6704_c0_g1_i1.p1  ORF type:complete len:503 (-),score=58.97 TRINITY_DN6704_c0_g1_i1:833-2341(-)